MHPGKALTLAGLGITLVGAYIWFGGKIPPFGRLPGDFRIEKEHFSFYFPLGTCLLISALISLLTWLLRR